MEPVEEYLGYKIFPKGSSFVAKDENDKEVLQVSTVERLKDYLLIISADKVTPQTI